MKIFRTGIVHMDKVSAALSNAINRLSIIFSE